MVKSEGFNEAVARRHRTCADKHTPPRPLARMVAVEGDDPEAREPHVVDQAVLAVPQSSCRRQHIRVSALLPHPRPFAFTFPPMRSNFKIITKKEAFPERVETAGL